MEDDALTAAQARVRFLETQFQRALDDKAALDARHRAEAADVREQKAQAIKERDEWKARCDQTKDGGQQRELELLRSRVKDMVAEIKLKEAMWDKREEVAHRTADALNYQHKEDIKMHEVLRKMIQHKDHTSRERETLLEGDIRTLRASNRTLQLAVDRQSRMSTVKELNALSKQADDLRHKLAIAENNLVIFRAENDRLNKTVRAFETHQTDFQRHLAKVEASYEQLQTAWNEQRLRQDESKQAAEKLRSELMAARGEKQLLERSLAELKSKAAKTAEKRKEIGRNVQSEATTVASQKAVIARLCEQIATLSGRAIEPDISALPTTGQSKRARTASVSDVSSARISPASPPPSPPVAPVPAADAPPSQTPSKRPAARPKPPDSDDDDDDDDDTYTFGKRQKRTVSGSSKASTSSTASVTDSSAMDLSPVRSPSPLSSKESTPRPRSVTPAQSATASTSTLARAGPGSSSASTSARHSPVAATSSQRIKTSPPVHQTGHAGIDIQNLELSDSDDSDDEIVVTGEKFVVPIKSLPRRNRTAPVKPPPPFPMKFSASQFSSSQRRPL